MDNHLTATGLSRRLGTWEDTSRPGYAALAARVRTLLADGRLTVGTRVPSERELAMVLGVGRGTVAAAYEDLREGGYLHRRRGSGTWTALPDGPDSVTQGAVTPFAPMPPETPARPGGVIDMAHAAPAPPVAALVEASRAVLEELPEHLAGPGYELLGIAPLREAVARRLSADGLPTTPDEVMITAGAQHGHALVARALVRPGDRVLIEQPTYPNAIELVRHSSARPVPVAMDERDGLPGWDVEALAAGLRESTPAMAYLVADHHNPTAAVMPAETRPAVVAAMRRHGVPLVVDDCMRELWLDGPPPPPVGAWATGRAAGGSAGEAPVLTLGSMSKTVWGGLRIGWIRGPRAVLRRIAAVRATDDVASPVHEQLVAAAVLARLDDLLPTRRAEYVRNRDHLRAALARTMPSWRAPSPAGGLSLWVALGEPRSSALVEAAGRTGVRLAPGPRFGVGGAFEGFLRVPYTQPPDVLDDAVARLAGAWDDLAPGASTFTTVV